ncbi:hypothetical protein T492DRAFT_1148419 [Pavlovales sp. CCMP2436]|nr:hypothetical protein T492DRAFT_1148419 [Pavlovales sp. CCMP2436]
MQKHRVTRRRAPLAVAAHCSARIGRSARPPTMRRAVSRAARCITRCSARQLQSTPASMLQASARSRIELRTRVTTGFKDPSSKSAFPLAGRKGCWRKGGTSIKLERGARRSAIGRSARASFKSGAQVHAQERRGEERSARAAQCTRTITTDPRADTTVTVDGALGSQQSAVAVPPVNPANVRSVSQRCPASRATGPASPGRVLHRADRGLRSERSGGPDLQRSQAGGVRRRDPSVGPHPERRRCGGGEAARGQALQPARLNPKWEESGLRTPCSPRGQEQHGAPVGVRICRFLCAGGMLLAGGDAGEPRSRFRGVAANLELDLPGSHPGSFRADEYFDDESDYSWETEDKGSWNGYLRWHTAAFLESPQVTAAMLVASIYAIYGNDVRLSLFSLASDEPFAVLFLICFILFGTEFVMGTWARPGYIFTLFWWLDCFSTLSMILDIPWFYLPIARATLPGFVLDEQWGGTRRAERRALQSFSDLIRATRIVRAVRIMQFAGVGRILERLLRSFFDLGCCKSHFSQKPELERSSSLPTLRYFIIAMEHDGSILTPPLPLLQWIVECNAAAETSLGFVFAAPLLFVDRRYARLDYEFHIARDAGAY